MLFIEVRLLGSQEEPLILIISSICMQGKNSVKNFQY